MIISAQQKMLSLTKYREGMLRTGKFVIHLFFFWGGGEGRKEDDVSYSAGK